MTITSSHEANARIAAAYDALPYDSPAEEKLDPEWVLGLAAVYGATAGLTDVLDIGCGSGTQLARARLQGKGRLVGVDLSGEACSRARNALQGYGRRAEIIQADILDLDASDLGQFDLIYITGVIFVVPQDVQRHILALIAQCLKPGGVAVLGYYAGALDVLRANLHRTLRAVVAEEISPQSAVARARTYLKHLETMLPQSPQRGLLEAAIRETQNLSDVVLYHEALNQAFEAVQTSQVEQLLGAQGVGFASYLGPTPFAGLKTSRERAIAADTLDFCYGSYRHAVFVRWPDRDQSPDLRRGNVIWTNSLATASPEPDISRPVVFKTLGNQSLTLHSPVTVAMLQSLKNNPVTWSAAFSLGLEKAASLGLSCPSNQEALSLAEFMKLWSYALVRPQAV
jgi:SAM-dependent methyltransferase